MAFIAQKPPTSESTANPSGSGSVGELRFVNDSTSGELVSIYRYNGSAWVKKADTTAPVITSLQQPTRPAASSLSENTLYFHVDSSEVDIVVAGTWVENFGRGGIPIGPPADLPIASTVNVGSLFYVSEQATESVPLGLYVQIGGAWVGVSTAGAPQTKLFTLDLPGTLSVNQVSRAFRPPTGGTIVSTHIDVDDPATDSPTGRSAIFDLLVGGTSVYTSDATRPTIPVGSATGSPAPPNTTSFTIQQPFVAKVIQVGTAPSAFPAVLGQDGFAGVTNGTTVSVTRHPSASVGNMQMECFYTNSDTITWTLPGTGDWVYYGNATGKTGTFKLHWFYRVDDGTAGPWVFTPSGTVAFLSRTRMLLGNVHQTTPIDTGASGSGIRQFNSTLDTGLGPGSLTTTVNNVLEVLWERTHDSVTTNPGPIDSGYTIYSGFSPTVATTNHIATIQRPTAGAQTAPTTTSNISTTSALSRIAVVGAGAVGGTRLGADARMYVRYTESS